VLQKANMITVNIKEGVCVLFSEHAKLGANMFFSRILI